MTVAEILTSLNGEGNAVPWVELQGVRVYPKLDFPALSGTPPKVNLTSVTAIKLFLNTETGELKSFLAKTVDSDEGRRLNA